jgi:hypothetical protein
VDPSAIEAVLTALLAPSHKLFANLEAPCRCHVLLHCRYHVFASNGQHIAFVNWLLLFAEPNIRKREDRETIQC